MRGLIGAVALAATLGGCATQPPEDPPTWLRTDGKRMTGDPALQQQFDIDRQICLGEAQKSAVGAPIIYYQGLAGAIAAGIIAGQRDKAINDVALGCMAEKGYALVPRSQAEAKHAEFVKTAAARARLAKAR